MLRLLKTMRAFVRRLYWNRLFLENRQACLDCVMRDFAAFLRVGHEPSPEARPERASSPYGSTGRRRDALGPVTVEGYVKMIRKLVKDAAEWYMEFWGDPISLPRARKPARVVREFLEEDEVRALLRACKTRRERALVATLAYSGLRIRELSRLLVSDIGWREKSLLVRGGKGSKDRIVCVAQACLDILRAYAAEGEKSPRTAFLQARPSYCAELSSASPGAAARRASAKDACLIIWRFTAG
jgi:integrase